MSVNFDELANLARRVIYRAQYLAAHPDEMHEETEVKPLNEVCDMNILLDGLLEDIDAMETKYDEARVSSDDMEPITHFFAED